MMRRAVANTPLPLLVQKGEANRTLLSRSSRGRRPTGPSTLPRNPDLPAPEKALRILRTPELAQGWPFLPFEFPGRYIFPSRPRRAQEGRSSSLRRSIAVKKLHPAVKKRCSSSRQQIHSTWCNDTIRIPPSLTFRPYLERLVP